MIRRPIAVFLPAIIFAFAPLPASHADAPRRTAAAWIGGEVTPSRLAAALLAETNRVRREHGCRPLRPLPELSAAAEDQAAYMALMLHAGHHNVLLGQSDVLDRVIRHGLRPPTVAENVAAQPAAIGGKPMSSAEIAAELVASWMESPGHRANLLNRRFTHLGCAARLAPAMGQVTYVFGAQVFSTLPREKPWGI